MVSRYSLRLYLLTLVMVCGFVALGMRLWVLQVKRHQEFAALVPGTSIVTQRVPGVRGEIKDRNGVTLASNRATFEVSLNLVDIEAEYRSRYESVPMFTYKLNGRTKEEPDIVAIVKDLVISPLEAMGLAVSFNATQLRVHYRSKKDVVPFRYRRDLKFEEFATFAENNLGLPGVNVSFRPVREYPLGSLACHILGYVREAEDVIPEDEVNVYRYYLGDDKGLAGVEKSYDSELRGTPGVRRLLKNEKGVLVGEVGYDPPTPGSTVYLTIDAQVQYLVERILREAGVGRAAAVVVEPTSGDILAMASVPCYNPNSFIPSISQQDWDAYTSNKTKPFLNRAVSASAPGSTFKIVTALAGCLAEIEKGPLDPLWCDGGEGYGESWMRCWISNQGRAHGKLYLDSAIKTSCNDFFYQYGNLAGIRRMITVGGLLGLGQPTGLPLDSESGGLLPTPEWLRMYGKPQRQWGEGDTAQVSIGQGAMAATPLQMANVTATVANGGVYHKPRLISSVVTPAGDTTASPSASVDLTREGITAEQIEKIRKGMWSVVNEGGGTARRAYSAKHITAGKTGSATVPEIEIDGEMREDTHAWFICFAPYDSPQIAVSVRVEGGKAGGKVAAPIAAEIIARVLALDEGYSVRLRPMPESEGNFDFFDEITFGGDGGSFGDEGINDQTDSAPGTENSAQSVANQSVENEPAAPTIKPEIDEQGRVE